jgi:hypothetical protein
VGSRSNDELTYDAHRIIIYEMTEEARRAADEWKNADAAAQAAEDRLREAWAAHALKRSPPPDRHLFEEVTRLRAFANTKLDAAIKLAHPKAKPPEPRR